MEIVMCRKILEKAQNLCNRRDLGYVEKVKDSFEPDSNQRPKNMKYSSKNFEIGGGGNFFNNVIEPKPG